MSITNDTRREAQEKANASQNRLKVLGVILGSSVPLGASQIADELGWPVTSVRPRCTELLEAGQIEAKGKHLLPSGRHEATFSAKAIEIPTTWTADGQGLFGSLSL